MFRKLAIILPVVIFAIGILFTSVLRTAEVKYEFSDTLSKSDNSPQILGAENIDIPYNLAYPGKVLPDSPLWSLKAFRDKIWLAITTNPGRKADLKLLFADKRIGMSKILFEKEKYEEGFSVLTKAEKYLEEALYQEEENREMGIDTSELLRRCNYASLKHQQTIEEILLLAPEDAKPSIIETKRYSKEVYEKTKQALQEKGLEAPKNPFNGG